MTWRVVWITRVREGKGVEEEEGEDYEDGGYDAVPKLAVHLSFDALFPLLQVLQRPGESIESPDIEGSKRSGERKDDEEDQWTYVFGSDG